MPDVLLPGRIIEILYLAELVEEEDYDPLTSFGPRVFEWITAGNDSGLSQVQRGETLRRAEELGFLVREDGGLDLTDAGAEYARSSLNAARLLH
ncbi:MAG: hypothetical protein IT326_10010 [Anaerolineae bacterium]|nr:hypothetical protein [Anaerolineae bacterium]